jgi:hypothetical protein
MLRVERRHHGVLTPQLILKYQLGQRFFQRERTLFTGDGDLLLQMLQRVLADMLRSGKYEQQHLERTDLEYDDQRSDRRTRLRLADRGNVRLAVAALAHQQRSVRSLAWVQGGKGKDDGDGETVSRPFFSSLPEDACFRCADSGCASPAIPSAGAAYVCHTTAAPIATDSRGAKVCNLDWRTSR